MDISFNLQLNTMYNIKLEENCKLKFILFFVKSNYQYYLLLFLERSLYMTGSRFSGPELVDDITMQNPMR